jgi:hypothetical protein
VSNRNFCSESVAQCHDLSIKLFCKRINHAATKPGFRLSEHAIRLTGAIVGDRKLPICSRHFVGNGNQAVLCCLIEGMFEGIDDELGDN